MNKGIGYSPFQVHNKSELSDRRFVPAQEDNVRHAWCSPDNVETFAVIYVLSIEHNSFGIDLNDLMT